jgi:PST family polysaccharide transporter
MMADEELRQAASRAVRGVAYVLVSSYTNMGMGFVTTILLTRLLAPEDFGAVALGAFLLGLLDVRTKLGLDYAFMHRQPTTEDLVGSHLSLQLGLAGLGLALAGAVRPLLLALGYSPQVASAVLILALVGLLEAGGTTARNLLEKDLRFGRSTPVVTGALAASYATSIVLAWRGFGYVSLLVGNAVNAGLGTLGFWLFAGARPRLRLERSTLLFLLRYGAALALGSYATIFVLQFDNFLVGTLVGVATLGYYERAYKVAQWPTGLVTHIVARVSLPFYARLQGDPPRLARAFGMTLWLIAAVALPLALAIFATAPDFVRLLFGEAWLPTALYLRFLVAYSVIRPLLDDAGALFVAPGHPEKATAVQVAQAAALIATATPLTLAFQARGTAVGVGLAFLVGVALTYRYVTGLIPLPLGQVLRGPALGTGAALLAVAWVAWTGGPARGWPLLPRVLAHGACVAGAFYIVLAACEGRALGERARFLWGLLLGRPAPAKGGER